MDYMSEAAFRASKYSSQDLYRLPSTTLESRDWDRKTSQASLGEKTVITWSSPVTLSRE